MSSSAAFVVVMTAIRDVTGEPNGDTNCPNFARLMEANVSGMKQTRSEIGAISIEYRLILRHDNPGDDTKYD